MAQPSSSLAAMYLSTSDAFLQAVALSNWGWFNTTAGPAGDLYYDLLDRLSPAQGYALGLMLEAFAHLCPKAREALCRSVQR